MGFIAKKRVKLRKLNASDAKFIVKWAKNKDITKYTSVIAPPCELKEAKNFIKKANLDIKNRSAYEFGIELKENKNLIGTINLSDINKKNKNAGVGIWLIKEYWGKGLSTEALNLILRFGFKDLGLEKIQARVLHKNTRAQKLLRRAGFKLEGRLRRKTFFNNQWFDDLIYGLLSSEYKE
jgi:ribosomal-protein-alanine N-acetyltransferase